MTSPFDVVKTRLQSDLFRDPPSRPSTSTSSAIPSSSSILPHASKQAESLSSAAALKARTVGARPQGVRGLVYHFVETGQIIRDIYVNEGPKALFKGLGPTLVGVVPARAINFSTYAQMKTVLASTFPSLSPTHSGLVPVTHNGATAAAGAESSPYIHLGAAAIAGIVTSTATNPIWVVKTRLQLEARQLENNQKAASLTSSSSSTSNAAKAAASALKPANPVVPGAGAVTSKLIPAWTMTKDILSKEGIRGMYKGMSASYLGVSEGVIQWVLYERLKKISTQTYPGQPTRSKLAEWVGIVGSSGGAKMVASLITYPHEVIRTRLRQAPNPGAMPKYTGLLQTLRLVIAEEGAASLYGGLSAHLMRVVPNAACMFTIYEIALRL